MTQIDLKKCKIDIFMIIYKEFDKNSNKTYKAEIGFLYWRNYA